jgi:hypothetical protein
MLAFVFEENRFKGEILPELERLKEARIARIIDLMVVRKDRSGAIRPWPRATSTGKRRPSSGRTSGRSWDSARRRRGRRARGDGRRRRDGRRPPLRREDVFRLTEVVEPGSSIALVLLEHLWMLPLLDAVQRAKGYELSNDWVSPERLVEFGLAPGDGV